ncbi:MAG: plastocyanin/azurin family copper-binding protein [Hyphomicrobiaceae bacterium]|nr:plastocyanin/azurin family copper-binding protein [Hyphomicrobiaceae bacterium]
MLLGSALAALLMLGISATTPPRADAASDAERAKICEEAEQRYQKLFGKPSKDEPVTIVKMYKYTFCPVELKVKQGTTVRWVNVDKRTSHSVWFKEQGKAESDRLFSEENVEIKMDFPPGDLGYLCGPHFEKEGMKARIIVTE